MCYKILANSSGKVAPLHLRAPISGLSVATTWVFNFIVAEITPIGFDTIKYQYYIIYACINAAMIPIVYFCYPEVGLFDPFIASV